jgi:hypothetical protein
MDQKHTQEEHATHQSQKQPFKDADHRSPEGIMQQESATPLVKPESATTEAYIYNNTIPAGSAIKETRADRADKRRKYQNSEERKRKRREWEKKPENIEKRKKYNEREEVKERQKKYYQEPEVRGRRKENAKFHREWKRVLGDMLKDGLLFTEGPDGKLTNIPDDPKVFLEMIHPQNDIKHENASLST